MKENNLLASVALFSQLYNNERYTNVGDILAEFIKSAVVTENRWVLNSTELTHLLEQIFDFKIPESVIRTTVKHRLKSVVTNVNGNYHFDTIIKNDFNEFDTQYNEILEGQNRIVELIFSYIQTQEKRPIQSLDKQVLIQNLNNYLLDSSSNDEYSQYISSFVIKNRDNYLITNDLNLVREGIILYQGIRYTSDINEAGRWNTELSIFLSTEHLFNAVGYNGVLYQQIFDDFYNLVHEINSNAKNKNGEKLIKLYYFEETKDEIDQFFSVAESIQKGTIALDSSKPAMKTILEGCKYPSDLINKKISFEAQLKKKGIVLKEFPYSIYKYNEYVVDDENVLEELKKESEKKGKVFDEAACRRFFKIYTKINFYRGGESRTKFERIESIFITANGFGLYLSHNNKVKFQDEDIPFAKDIDYITSKFWFKLRKGFNNKGSLPKSFDVITKAQIILSSQLNQTISNEYHRLQKEYKEGKISKEEAKERNYYLRQKPNKPEEIDSNTVEQSLDFINNDSYFEDLHREKELEKKLHLDTLKRNRELEDELNQRKQTEYSQKLAKAKELLNTAKNEFIDLNLFEVKKGKQKDVIYCMGVYLLTALPVIIAITLKGNQNFNKYLEDLGNNQYFILGILVLISFSEIFFRSYIFNKDRIKNGWNWFVNNNKNLIIEDKIKEFELEFLNQNSAEDFLSKIKN